MMPTARAGAAVRPWSSRAWRCSPDGSRPMAEPAIVIIGAGPAGVRAAATLARAGRRIVLIDENMRIGGQIYRQPPPGAERPPEALYGFEAGQAVLIPRAPARLRILYPPENPVWD